MDKLKKLLEIATDSDKVELKILHNASISCLKSYNEDPISAKLKDLNAARAGLDESVNRLWAVYFPEEERFATVKEALAYLRAKGYKIASSKFYTDIKSTGKTPAKVQRQTDGSFLKRDLLLYAKTLTYLGDPSAGLDQAQRRKLELENRKLEKQTEILTHELKVKEKLFVNRDHAEQERSAMISIMEANIKNLHLTRAGDYIAMVSGDSAATARLIEAMGQDMDDMFNSLSKTKDIELKP